MSKLEKTIEEVAAERAEMARISADILKLITTIPPRIVNSSGVAAVRQYKEAVNKARSAATSAKPNLGRLRTAHDHIRSFYL